VFVLLHCNGGNGSLAVGRWAKIVHPDGVLCVGPNSLNQAAAWRDNDNEGIDFVKALVDEVAKRFKIDRKRIYIGGYSAGACHSCRLGIPNSDYFAGIITYAGCSGPMLGPRKIAVALVHGERDGNIKVDGTRRLHQTLKDAGWPVWYKEIPGQGHSYNAKYNREAWEWVKKHPPQDPPELVSKQKLEEAKEAFKKGDYDKAYEAYRAALDTGVNKEEAGKGIEEIEKLGAKEIEDALKEAGDSASKAKHYLGKIKSRYKGTPVASKAQEEIDRLLAEEAAGRSKKETQQEREAPSGDVPVEKQAASAEELMEKADKFIGMGMKAAARQYLQRIIDDFSDSPLVEEAKRKLEEIEE
jgi:predicted esterase